MTDESKLSNIIKLNNDFMNSYPIEIRRKHSVFWASTVRNRLLIEKERAQKYYRQYLSEINEHIKSIEDMIIKESSCIHTEESVHS